MIHLLASFEFEGETINAECMYCDGEYCDIEMKYSDSEDLSPEQVDEIPDDLYMGALRKSLDIKRGIYEY